MDLSLNKTKKLQLKEFLLQNLDGAPAPRVIEWVDRSRGVFRILWTHQSSGTFRHEDAALFRYWAIARGKSADLSSVELKQNFRMALNKSPYVILLPDELQYPDYRYFQLKDWSGNSRSTVRRVHSPALSSSYELEQSNHLFNYNFSSPFPNESIIGNTQESLANLPKLESPKVTVQKKKSKDSLFRPYDLDAESKSSRDDSSYKLETNLFPYQEKGELFQIKQESNTNSHFMNSPESLQISNNYESLLLAPELSLFPVANEFQMPYLNPASGSNSSSQYGDHPLLFSQLTSSYSQVNNVLSRSRELNSC